MAMGNWELKHEYFAKHLRMGTVRMKYDKETNEEVRREYGKRQSGHERKRRPDGISLPNQNT